ncbi:MAG: hypothetical protein LBC20_00015, partial [Planctomycetaceae bacterium]|jgi:hypothetical protein|nr:hypothetical protein [Planctomycetaceae bacterium]
MVSNIVHPQSDSDVTFPITYTVHHTFGHEVPLEIYEDKIVINRPTMYFEGVGNVGSKTIYFSKIIAVQIDCCYFQFVIPEEIQYKEPVVDENTITFSSEDVEAMYGLQIFIEMIIFEHKDPNIAAITLLNALGRKKQNDEEK